MFGRLTTPLIEKETTTEGVEEVFELMNAYEMTREDWETITTDLSLKKEPPKIASTTRAALTRKCNAQAAGHHIVQLGKRQASDEATAEIGERETEGEQRQLPTSEEGGGTLDEDGEEDDDEQDDDDLKKDKLIKAVTPKSRTKKSTPKTSTKKKK